MAGGSRSAGAGGKVSAELPATAARDTELLPDNIIKSVCFPAGQ